MSIDKQPPDDLSVSRRGFFRHLLLRSIEQVEDAGRAMRDNSLSAFDISTDKADSPDINYLRPPGALPEEDFANTCSQCGKCAEVCPAMCIKLDDNIADGLPHIVARISPCVICDDLSCMKNCPSGALQPLPVGTLIEMGTAEVDHHRCLRTDDGGSIDGGEDCRICIGQCPIGETALAVGDDHLIDVREGCTGCGVCEQVCPTEPASIVVIPQ